MLVASSSIAPASNIDRDVEAEKDMESSSRRNVGSKSRNALVVGSSRREERDLRLGWVRKRRTGDASADGVNTVTRVVATVKVLMVRAGGNVGMILEWNCENEIFRFPSCSPLCVSVLMKGADPGKSSAIFFDGNELENWK